jgi:hypothetical protein
MTPKFYNAMKTNLLARQNPLVRSHVNTYFEWLKTIKPEEVIDAIEMGTTPQQAYKQLGANPIRLGIAAARGFLKAMPKYRAQLKEVATPKLARLTLKFENPTTYAVIQKYGKKGAQFIDQWVNGALEILGVLPKPQEEQKSA